VVGNLLLRVEMQKCTPLEADSRRREGVASSRHLVSAPLRLLVDAQVMTFTAA